MSGFLHSPDIEEQILAALAQVFTLELITNCGGYPSSTGDSLALKTLKQMPLQDDPTLAAPYLVYAPDTEKGVELNKDFPIEMGGPSGWFWYHFRADIGTPLATTREVARSQAANLVSRVVSVLTQYFDLAGVTAPGALTSADQSRRIEGGAPQLMFHTHPFDYDVDIFGGEQTFYGKGSIYWRYLVANYQPFRINTSGH